MRMRNRNGVGGFKNRSRLEIIASVLERAQSGALKTHLMYAANLSYTMLDVYLDFLLDNGLLSADRVNEKTQTFTTTQKGRKFIELFKGIQQLAFGTGEGVEKVEKKFLDLP
jgi:predicted transcriptional regulator